MGRILNQDKDQLFQQGVIAHRDGDLKEAERCYRLVLASDSKHPDANHNLGIIAVSVDQAERSKAVLADGNR